GDPEHLAEGGVHRFHPEPSVEYHQGLAHGLHDGAGENLGSRTVDVEERQDRAVDAVLQVLVRPDAEREPAAAPILDVALVHGHRVHRLRAELLQVWTVDVRLDVPDRPSHVSRDQVQDLLGHRREAADTEIDGHDDDGDLHAREQVREVAVHPAQLIVAAVQLLVHRVELLVGRLELLLGGVQLLVRALQLLVARQRLLVRRLQLLVRRLELLDGRLQVLAVRSQLPLELANPRSLAPGGRPAVSLARRASAWRPTLLGLLLEEDEEVHLPVDDERDYVHAQVAPVVIRLDAQALLAHRRTPLLGLAEGLSETVDEALARHGRRVQAGFARARFKGWPCAPADL